MRAISSAILRPAVVGTVVLAVASAAILAAPSAMADTAPVLANEAPSVSSDALPTPQIDGVVWSQGVAGDTVFVGGEFQKARPAGSAAGVNTVTRSNLLAYDVTTGVLNPTFAPSANAAVRVVAVSPDRSRVYVGGNFTSISGAARYRIAAFDTTTGALVPGFAPVLNYTVNSIVATNDTVYFGGGFSSVSGQARQGAAAVSASNGALLPWAPALVGGKANGMVLSPDGSKIAIGGAFTSMNGSTNPGYGLGMVSSSGTGKTTLPFKANSLIKNAGANGSITSLYGNADGIFGSGYDFGSGANFEGSFRATWADGTITWLEDCHGDTYSVFAVNGLEYKAGHAHHCANIGGFPEVSPRVEHRASAYTVARTGTVKRNTVGNYVNFEGQPAPSQVNWFPDINTGSYTGQTQGPWNVSGDARYVLYGGEFTRVNNKAQQGLVRFAVPSIAPNKDGPQVTGADFKPTLSDSGSTGIKLTFPSNWDRDNESLTYQVLRAGAAAPVGQITASSRFWKRPTLTFTDTGLTPGQTYSYSIRAVDPFGNAVTGQSVSRAVPGGTPNTAPIAAFSSSATGLTASFNGSTSSDPDGSISAWSWSFGDGSTGSGSSATRTYAASGTYSVTLTVTDNRGASASTTKSITVNGTVTPPPPAGTLASDNFERTISGGWGTATAGGGWSVSGGASGFSVGSGSGSINTTTAGANLIGKLPGVSTTGADLTVRTSLAQPATGSSAYVTAIGRAVGSDDYRARIVVNEAGKVNLQLLRGSTTLSAVTVTGITYSPGEQLQLRLQVFGTSPTTIQAKVWRTGSAEPAAWTLSTTDSTAAMQTAGSVGLGFYVGASSTGLPRQAAFDDFVVKAL